MDFEFTTVKQKTEKQTKNSNASLMSKTIDNLARYVQTKKNPKTPNYAKISK